MSGDVVFLLVVAALAVGIVVGVYCERIVREELAEGGTPSEQYSLGWEHAASFVEAEQRVALERSLRRPTERPDYLRLA